MTHLEIQQTFDLALRHHQAGRLQEAEQLYRQILGEMPTHVGALHYLGVMAHQEGRNDVAIDLIRKAIAPSPNLPEPHNNLGLALKANGQADEAIAAYRRAIALKPNYVNAFFNLGVALQDKGQLDEAITDYRQAIALKPDHAGMLYQLACALKARGRLDEAAGFYRKAIALKPDFLDAYSNLGFVLNALGRLDQAIAAYRQAIALNPGDAGAHSNLGNALRGQNRLDESIAVFRQAIALDPNLAEAQNNLGCALTDAGQLNAAITALNKAVALNSHSPEAHNNLGEALRRDGRLNQAIAAYRQAIALRPGFADAHSNLGIALKQNGQLDEAIDAYRHAITLDPQSALFHYNLGIALGAKDQFDDAIAVFRRAIVLNPNLPGVHNGLGDALRNIGLLDGAIAAFRRALTLDPSFAEAHNNLGVALQSSGRLDEAIAAYRQAARLDPTNVKLASNVVYALHFHPGFSASAIAEEHARWDKAHAQPLRKLIPAHSNDRSPDRRLRVGYVSPDFRVHVVGRHLVPLLEHHDRQQFHITCYSQVTSPDAMTTQSRNCVDHWCDIVGLSDEQVARQIREDRIDILVDLTLHMANNRLLVFATKPAPVQVTYLAYLGSSGLTTMDYRLSDPYLDPPDADLSSYSEQTLRLPRTYWCYRPLPAPSPTSAPAVQNDFITFGCLNNFAKVSLAALDLWARILVEVPRSRLIIHASAGNHQSQVKERLDRAGVTGDRIRFVGMQPWTQYMQSHSEIDIGLDPFPYGGGITTCDALWMGVPVVTLSGQTAVGRGGRSILSNLGLPELVAFSQDQYLQIAVALARDRVRLHDLRLGLRQRMLTSPLMDAAAFARDMEAAYRQMWRKWCAQSPARTPALP